MVQKQRDQYLSMRRKFEPATVTLVIVAESPPVGGKYLYDPAGKVSEPLFDALIKQLGIQPKTKIDGLREFQSRGWVLVDATYEPVNAPDKTDKDLVIARDYQELCGDLKRLLAGHWREIPLILIKSNVCRMLEPKLNEDGFKVLNKGRIVPFPSHGHQPVFDRRFREIVQQTLTPLSPRPEGAADAMDPMELACEECSRILDGLKLEDQLALVSRLVTITTIKADDPEEYIAELADGVRTAIRSLIAGQG
jgi:hypothetical protein